MTPTDSAKTTATTMPTDEPRPQFSTSASLRDIRHSVARPLGNSVTPPLCQTGMEAIGAAIQRCLPGDYDRADNLLFRLAREWKALASDDDCPVGVREFVRHWFDAGGHTVEGSFDVVWLCFLVACESVKFPKGTGPVELAMEAAKGEPWPSAALRFEDERVRLLVSVCCKLQLLSGPSPFYLSCRMAGELIGVSHDTANVLLRGLGREGILDEIAKGGITARGKLATRWRFIAPMD